LGHGRQCLLHGRFQLGQESLRKEHPANIQRKAEGRHGTGMLPESIPKFGRIHDRVLTAASPLPVDLAQVNP